MFESEEGNGMVEIEAVYERQKTFPCGAQDHKKLALLDVAAAELEGPTVTLKWPAVPEPAQRFMILRNTRRGAATAEDRPDFVHALAMVET